MIEVVDMLNNEKIILMTKLSLYEQKNQKKEITTGKYFKSDYMLIKMLGSFASVTVGYLLSIVLWFLYSSDRMLAKMTTTGNFIGIAVILVIVYVVLCIIYMVFSYAFFSHRFRKIRKNLKEYNGDLKTLHRIQEQEYDAILNELEEGSEEVK